MKKWIAKFFELTHLTPLYVQLYGYRAKKRLSGQWILGRVACLGLDTYAQLDIKYPLYNIQKGRVDYLYKVNQTNPEVKADAAKVIRYIERDDIKSLIIQQQFAQLSFGNAPQMLFMDSYSELTDQLFVAKKGGSSFCCNYSDLKSGFNNEYNSLGLLPENVLVTQYHAFFSMIREKFGLIDIIFIHFPARLETREGFIKRHHLIKEAIHTVQPSFLPFYVYEVPDELVEHAEGDNFPYHYSSKVYEFLRDAIAQRIN